MPYPHQPGSPSFEGGAAYEAYLDEQVEMNRKPGISKLVYDKRRRTIVTVSHSRFARFRWMLKSYLSR